MDSNRQRDVPSPSTSLVDSASAQGAVVILLGAGRPYRGTDPSALQHTPDQRRTLDWIVDAFARLSVDWHYVGGYQLRDVVRSYPGMSYSVNADWKKTGSVASLFAAPLDTGRIHFVVYTDVIFRPEVVQRVSECEADIVLAVDRNWKHRYQRRRPDDMGLAEKVRLEGDVVTAVGMSLDSDRADAEFTGLLKLSPEALDRIVRLRDRSREEFTRAGLPELIDQLLHDDLSCVAVDVSGQWAELNAPQDLARFVLGTKAETLERLRPLVRKSSIGDQVSLTVAIWKTDSDSILQRLTNKFGDAEVVVRSSALAEDSWSTANAGVFLSLTHVTARDQVKLRSAVDQVIASFDDGNDDNQVLVQRMLINTQVSGVAFTRSLSSGAPYYIVNYDDTTGCTESVTGGTGRQLKTLLAHRNALQLPRDANPRIEQLFSALAELESLVGHDSLDVEFAIDEDDRVHILQVRPIAVDHSRWRVSDELVEEMLVAADRDFRRRQTHSSFALGRRTVFGIMPDWNPAEIIGTKPRRLATSLYRYLVTDEIWAAQRAGFGYRDVRPCPLLTCFLGHPYIDVRACFSSFIPATLPEHFAERLVKSYLDRLQANPHLHDKVEFEIVLTCLTFDFDRQADRLRADGFSPAEIEQLRDALRKITRHAFERYPTDLAEISVLKKRFGRLSTAKSHPLSKACALLEDCRRFGTLPFAHLARGAFVATALLRSAVREGLMSEEELGAFMNSLNTVARRFAEDGTAVAKGVLDWQAYQDRYGHLRPGTYEITSPSYAEDPARYLSPMISAEATDHGIRPEFSWKEETRQALLARLRQANMIDDSLEFDDVDRFLRETIEGREYSKFVFTQNLSVALESLAAFGEELGLSRERLSHIAIEDLQTTYAGMAPSDIVAWLGKRAEEGEEWYNLTQAVELPPLLMQAEDMHAFIYPESRPNFVSLGNVTAEVVDLTEAVERVSDLSGKIALIPQADPGYDWLFGQNIAGLITMYGGANSHMAIRAAEFGLSASIGVGESLYAQYRHAPLLELDCAGRHIRVVSR